MFYKVFNGHFIMIVCLHRVKERKITAPFQRSFAINSSVINKAIEKKSTINFKEKNGLLKFPNSNDVWHETSP